MTEDFCSGYKKRYSDEAVDQLDWNYEKEMACVFQDCNRL